VTTHPVPPVGDTPSESRGEPAATTDAAILIPCEGSGQPGHNITGFAHTLCAMCGSEQLTDEGGMVAFHWRDDVLARLKRGDFG
jgi:hypothetical protein